MAEPIFDSIVTGTAAVGASFTPSTLPSGYVDGDLIVFWVGQDGGSGTLSIATAGWSIHGTRTGTPAGGAFGSWFSTVVSGGTFNTPTFDSTLSDDYAYIGFIVRGAPSSSYVDVVGTQTDWNTVGNAAAGTPTTGTDGCLVLHGWVADGSVQFRPDITDANLIAQVADSGKSIAVTYRQQETDGPVDAMQMYFNKATEGGTQFTLCIKNDTGAKLAPDVRVTGDLVSWYGDFSAASAALTWKGLEETGNKFAGGFTSGLLDGITVTTGAVTTATTSGAGNNPVGTDTLITTSTTNNRIDGAWHAYSANLDGRIFSVEVATSRPGTVLGGRIGVLGLLIGFSDGTNYEIFRVKNIVKGWAPVTAYRVFVGCGTTTPTYSRGTLDWANITQVAYMLHHINTSADTLSVRNGVLLDRMTLTGGSAASPISSRDLFVATSQNYLGDLIGISGKSQVQPTTKFQIGDGTNTTHFANSATSTEFPQEWADTFTPNWQDGWHVGDSSVEIRIKPKPTDSIDLSAAIFATDTLQGFVYDSGGSSSADLAHVGCSVVGFSPVELLAGTTIIGKTYSGCGTVQTHGANLTNVTVADTLSTNAAVSVDVSGSVLDGCPIDGTGAAYALELDTGVTDISLTNCSITSGSLGKLHILSTTGNVEITIDGTTSLVDADVDSDGATWDIIAPELYQSVTVSGAIANSQIHVADVDYTLTVSGITVTPTAGATYTHNDITWTVVSASITAGAGTLVVYGLGSPADSGTLTKASGTGDASVAFSAFVRNVTTLYNGAPIFPYTWTDGTAAAAARAIRLRVAYCQTTSARTFIESYIGVCGITDGTEAISYNASQVADTTYNTHALDGPAILALGEITISDLGTDLITVDTAGGTMGWPTIYAAFVAWMASSSGIDDEIAYCDSPDPVNFIWENTRIKCPIGTALSVTDGWGRDSVTGLSITLWDNAGGAIGFSADHGIGYSTGSGLTTAQNAKLMALPDATTIAQEVVTGITF